MVVYTDLLPPTLAFTTPLATALLNTTRPTLTLHYGNSGQGVDPATLQLQVNDAPLAVSCTATATELTCTPGTALPEGPVTLSATIEDFAGNVSTPATLALTIDPVAPVITVTTPAAGLVTNQVSQTLLGQLSEAATLTLNGQALTVATNRTFTQALTLQDGLNPFALSATDPAGNVGTATVQVTLDTTAPPAPTESHVTVGSLSNGQVTLTGAAGSVEGGAQVRVTNSRTGETVTVTANADGSFSATLSAQGGDGLALVGQDGAGNSSTALLLPVGSAPPPLPLPPDPSTVAPPLDRTVATTLIDSASFLFTGSNPIQTGVAPGTMGAKRIAVLRGKVLKKDNSPLSGVTITIPNHPELGQTLSRADGLFDLAVNGGGLLTVNYEKAGYLPAQRQIDAPWQDYAWLPDVVLIQPDPQVTTIDLTDTTAPMQVAAGSVVTDADGTRQAVVLIPQGTTATLVLPDGSTQPLSTLHVRATEYTVGANGPESMPGQLPPTSAYTYAVELSADEAIAAGAKEVRFNQPIPFYVANFLGFPVGGIVPVGT